MHPNFLDGQPPLPAYLQMLELAPRRLAVERPKNESLDDVIAAPLQIPIIFGISSIAEMPQISADELF